MSKIHEIMVTAILPAIKAVGKLEMENVLSGIKEQNGVEAYLTTVHRLYFSFSLLKEAAIKTKTRIDDGIVDLVLEAVKESAANNKIVLADRELAP